MASKLKNGILLLTHLPNKVIMQEYLKAASSYAQDTLFVQFDTVDQNKYEERIARYQLVNMIYGHSLQFESPLNIHVLLAPLQNNLLNLFCRPDYKLFCRPDVCLLHRNFKSKTLENKIKDLFNDISFKYLDFEIPLNDVTDKTTSSFPSLDYSGVVIGGTFDRIHNGHKLLLATALLLADEKITVGVADGELLKNKILSELIEPVDERISNIQQLIELYKPGLNHKVVSITDPCGPSGTDDDLQLLVVSQETHKGGDVVNKKRCENNLLPLEVFIIDLIEEDEDITDLSSSLNSEGKLSSSAERVRSLGVLRKTPNGIKEDNKCYIIGMTGGIASGKSSVVKRLEKLGAYTINCDKLGHEAYLPGQIAYNKIIENFGVDVLADDKTIDRKKLGPLVFGDRKKLELLNNIVWPEIKRMRNEIIEKVEESGSHDIIVFEGAILFEAGWEQDAHEVWCCVIAQDEAIGRIQSRDGLSNEHALKRITSQMSNQDRVNRSHVVFCTQWEHSYTQKQVEKAWNLLHKRITSNLSSSL